ncbi:unnamed protein product [Ectocarpus sp. 8 AP-2014]
MGDATHYVNPHDDTSAIYLAHLVEVFVMQFIGVSTYILCNIGSLVTSTQPGAPLHRAFLAFPGPNKCARTLSCQQISCSTTPSRTAQAPSAAVVHESFDIADLKRHIYRWLLTALSTPDTRLRVQQYPFRSEGVAQPTQHMTIERSLPFFLRLLSSTT